MTNNELVYYPPQMFLMRDNFKSRAEYLKNYRACCSHYGFKTRVEGGWIFFEFSTDYEIWKNQK